MSRWRSLLILGLLWTGESAGFPTGSEAGGAEAVAAGALESSGTPGRGQRARCAGCSPELCAEAVGCRAGLVPDRCGCCLECGNSEGQPCDLDRTSGFYGLCGPDLKCTLDTSDLSRGEVPEPLCACKSQEALCGSDGKTYENIFPDIKRPPANLVTATGDSAIFPCEVFAFPMALSEWRRDGDDVILPGDDPRISVQSRGGPLRYETSSWLQIEGVTLGDAGTYRCIAHNGLGSVSASADLTVLGQDVDASLVPLSTAETFPSELPGEYDDYY
nr:PREDICTED: kazal-type serine protease inhibitor domain-containing protein 1-like isoform X2 [Lepisosteus oculatus]